jgi:hypothetical protein
VTDIPTRDELIALCDRGIVPIAEWSDRDTAKAQRQLAWARALLKAGAPYREAPMVNPSPDTHWIEVTWPGFDAFEQGRDFAAGYHETSLHYIPTAERLDRTAGRDWY